MPQQAAFSSTAAFLDEGQACPGHPHPSQQTSEVLNNNINYLPYLNECQTNRSTKQTPLYVSNNFVQYPSHSNSEPNVGDCDANQPTNGFTWHDLHAHQEDQSVLIHGIDSYQECSRDTVSYFHLESREDSLHSHELVNNDYVYSHRDDNPVNSYQERPHIITDLSPGEAPDLSSISDRPLGIDSSIQFPYVDHNVLQRQWEIFASIWPSPSEEASKLHPEFCQLHSDILSFHLPNFIGARKTVQSGLNLDRWEQLLRGNHDNEICYYLRYGWPVGYHSATIPQSITPNHPSATSHPTHIEEFIKKELSHDAMVGPFTSPPFKPWFRISPMMTRPKKKSTKRRVIIDISFPEGKFVNDCIRIDSIYSRDSTYTLPAITDLTNYIKMFLAVILDLESWFRTGVLPTSPGPGWYSSPGPELSPRYFCQCMSVFWLPLVKLGMP